MTNHNKLKLKAVAAEDIEVLSALLQDSLVAAPDIRFLEDESSLMMVLNRYCWEQDSGESQTQPLRCMCGLKVTSVSEIKQRGLSGQVNQFYNLLSVTYEQATKRLTFTFSEGCGIRLVVDRLAVLVQDVADPHPGFARPQHDDG